MLRLITGLRTLHLSQTGRGINFNLVQLEVLQFQSLYCFLANTFAIRLQYYSHMIDLDPMRRYKRNSTRGGEREVTKVYSFTALLTRCLLTVKLLNFQDVFTVATVIASCWIGFYCLGHHYITQPLTLSTEWVQFTSVCRQLFKIVVCTFPVLFRKTHKDLSLKYDH